jgi:imidazolonepropionase-like amidohydrolase
MLPRLTSLPLREDDPIDLPYRLPKLLQDAGVKFCIQNEGDMEAMNARNIPFLAGIAMSYGLTEEEAIRSVSLSACEIVGIEKQFGSIEEGKMATLFVSKGNALDMRTNDVTLILINGQFAEVTNRQTELYEKYKAKYGLD